MPKKEYNMDNRKYEALIIVSETGSITQAADRMGYTQSGITQMINSMEKELDVKLLTRTNKGAHLTTAGKKLLPYMKEENLWERYIRQECDRMHGLESGLVTVGCLSSISAAWMPTILEAFSREHPGIRVNMVEGESPELDSMLMDGRIDLALADIHEKKSYVSRPLVQDEILAIMPNDPELAGRSSITLDELMKYPYISYATGSSENLNLGWLDRSLPNRFKPTVMYTSKSDFTAIQMVSHHLGVSLAGRLMIESYPLSTTNLSLDPPMYRQLGIAYKSHTHILPAARSFMECAENVIRSMQDEEVSL